MSKEKKPTQTPNRDPEIRFDRSNFFQNTLSLPQAFKDKLAAEGLDYRFLNSTRYRFNGNRHGSHWRAYKIEGNPAEYGISGVTPEGFYQVGDLILGVREKKITRMHKEFLADRNSKLAIDKVNKRKARELKGLANEYGIGDEHKIHEGFDDNE